MRKLTHSLILLLFFLSTPVLLAQSTDSPSGKNGMVATAHPLATEAALEIFKAGGNAIDAAVAAAFAIGVVEPDGSGIGGGGGMVVFLKEKGESYFINYYGRSSENALSLNFNSNRDARTTKAIGVPGNVGGLTLAHKKFGSLPLSTVMAPAIRYAEEGFAIDATLAGLILDNIEIVAADPGTAANFTDEGFPKMEGDIIVQKDLAKVLRAIAENGSRAFYRGEYAKTFVKTIQERGGVLTEKDFASYKPVINKPLRGSYRGYNILAANLPESGVTLIQGLNMIENFDLKASGHFSESAKTFHIMAETSKLMYADRYDYLGDPDFVEVPVDVLISKEYAKARFNTINPERLDPPTYREAESGDPFNFGKTEAYALEPEPEMTGGHTTHLSVIDKDGNAVALTQTLGLFFGSAQTISGVMFNCAMTNYSYSSKNSPNIIDNGKQCRSSITPAILLKDGAPFLVIGSPGAGRIIGTLFELITNVIDFDMSPAEANLAPRFYCLKHDDFLHLESGIKPEVRKQMEEMGHKLKVYEGIDLFFGGAQMIYIDPETGIYYGSADRRRGGIAKGY
ncbi:MAG: gamma-glutamyltransferase [Marinilabiliaceae bacterium]|nr:gamma-glutamyltransferase [Marinilabiliaceae bacterium]